MNDIKEKEHSDIIKLLYHKEIEIPKPFEREIYLFDTYVAGTSHVVGILELEPHLKIDDKLNFFREPENPYDNKAIVIKTENSAKIGYVPQDDNIIFSRLMDAGKLLYGKIVEKEIKNNWVLINIKVFLKD